MWAVCVCGNETSPLFLLNWASQRHTLIISTAGTGDRPSRGWRVGTDRHIHTHRRKDRQNTHTQTHTVNQITLMLMQKEATANLKKIWTQTQIYTLTHTHTAPERPWQSVIQITTYDDILLAPQEQSSALMRRLTFSRSGHSEATQIQLIQQINSYYQNLRDFLLLALREVAICFQTTTNKVSHL